MNTGGECYATEAGDRLVSAGRHAAQRGADGTYAEHSAFRRSCGGFGPGEPTGLKCLASEVIVVSPSASRRRSQPLDFLGAGVGQRLSGLLQAVGGGMLQGVGDGAPRKGPRERKVGCSSSGSRTHHTSKEWDRGAPWKRLLWRVSGGYIDRSRGAWVSRAELESRWLGLRKRH